MPYNHNSFHSIWNWLIQKLNTIILLYYRVLPLVFLNYLLLYNGWLNDIVLDNAQRVYSGYCVKEMT